MFACEARTVFSHIRAKMRKSCVHACSYRKVGYLLVGCIILATIELSYRNKQILKSGTSEVNISYGQTRSSETRDSPEVLSDKAEANDFLSVEERNRIRRRKLKAACKRIGVAKTSVEERRPYMRLIMDPNRHISYCRVNKAASTHTLYVLNHSFNCSTECLRSTAEEVRGLPYQEMRRVISKSFKFTFVREPYGRLFSTYSNKFYFPKGNWKPVGPEAVRRYRENPSNDSLVYGHDLTFHEMIRYTVDNHENRKRLDVHLEPMHDKCYPCEYQYDFIGKLETLDSDFRYLTNLWAREGFITNPVDDPGEKNNKIKGMMDFFRSTLLRTKESTISRFKLYLRAWTYYQIVGAVYKHIDFPFDESSDIDVDIFAMALKEAIVKSELFKEETNKQKTEALLQAYDSVPVDLLQRLQNVVYKDCMLYDYDSRPEWVFGSRETVKPREGFNYFKGLD